MFVDENSKKLINYLTNHEPSKVDGRKIYPVPYLVSAFDPDQNHWSEECLKPYLVTLQELGLITSFQFINRQSIQIELTARLLHFDEYQSADKLIEQPETNKNSPDTSVKSPYLTFLGKTKEFLSVASNLVTIIGGLIAFIGFLIAYFG